MLMSTASGTGVGSNPTFWFVAVAFPVLCIARFAIANFGKETTMEKMTTSLKTQKNSRLNILLAALAETTWAIATGLLAGVVTQPIHQDGALQGGSAVLLFQFLNPVLQNGWLS